jgi:hypothetical protein
MYCRSPYQVGNDSETGIFSPKSYSMLTIFVFLFIFTISYILFYLFIYLKKTGLSDHWSAHQAANFP